MAYIKTKRAAGSGRANSGRKVVRRSELSAIPASGCSGRDDVDKLFDKAGFGMTVASQFDEKPIPLMMVRSF